MDQEDINLREQIRVVWRARWFVAGVTLVFAAVAIGASFVLPKQFEATIMLAPVNMSSGGGGLGSLGGMASQFGGLAALAGINIGGDSNKAESIAVLQSEYLTEAYIQKNNLLPELYNQQWDPARNAWKPMAPKKVPTLWKANRKFDQQVRKVTTNAKSGLVTLAITWRDPRLAADWANGMVRMANDYLRDKAIRESERNIDYLNSEAAKSGVVEVKQAIYSIMKTEINRAMIARGSNEYAFKIVDPATPAEVASAPKKPLWAIGGLALGFMVSLLAVFIRASFAR